MNNRLDACTSLEVEKLLKDSSRCAGIILPVGSLEQHGPFLPLGCDMMIARGASESLAGRMHSNSGYQALVMPDFSYTPSPGAEFTTGTVSVGFDCMGRGLMEVLKAALRTDWKFVILINGHAHNHGRVIEASMAGSSGQLGRTLPVLAIHLYDYIRLTDSYDYVPGSHAGEFEVALLSYYTGFKPDMNRACETTVKPRPSAVYGLPIMERSMNGVLAPKWPDINRALSVAERVGSRIDQAVHEDVVANLDTCFAHWSLS